MFADWTDPYDIDHYYADVGKIFNKVAAYQDPIDQPVEQTQTIQPQEPTPVSNTAVTKSEFEVTPNSIFIDGHPVGSQPAYNILRSGPPSKDTYIDRYQGMSTQPYGYLHSSREYLGTCDIWMSIMWLIIIVLLVQVVRLNATMSANRIMFETLLATLGQKK